MDQEDMPRYRPPPNFCQMLRASGGGWETWRHADEDIKMHQFGWKSTTDESGYTPGTLIGNWNEERWDIKELMKVKTLPSQVRYGTTSICRVKLFPYSIVTTVSSA